MRLSAASEEQRGARIESTRRQSNNPLWSTGYGHALLISSLMSAEIIWSRSAPRNATTFFERDLDTMRRLFDQRLFPSPRLLHTHTHPLHTQTVYTNTDIWPPHVFFFPPPPPPRSLLNLITANLLAHIGRFGGTRQKCKQQLWRSYISRGSFPIDANRLASAGTWFCCCFFFKRESVWWRAVGVVNSRGKRSAIRRYNQVKAMFFFYLIESSLSPLRFSLLSESTDPAEYRDFLFSSCRRRQYSDGYGTQGWPSSSKGRPFPFRVVNKKKIIKTKTADGVIW